MSATLFRSGSGWLNVIVNTKPEGRAADFNLADNTVRLNLAVFTSDYTNMQLTYRGPADLSGEYYLDQPDWGPPPAMPPLSEQAPNTLQARWGIEGR